MGRKKTGAIPTVPPREKDSAGEGVPQSGVQDRQAYEPEGQTQEEGLEERIREKIGPMGRQESGSDFFYWENPAGGRSFGGQLMEIIAGLLPAGGSR